MAATRLDPRHDHREDDRRDTGRIASLHAVDD
jgi:hypothetical protein